MSKLKRSSAVIIAAVLAGTAVPVIASADTTYGSTGTITYTPSTAVTPPVDPQDPTVPVTPVTPNPTDPSNPGTPNPGTAGPLSIDFASSFDFGQQEITSVDKVYDAAAQSLSDGSTRTNYVQVTDNRGTLAGWSLNVEATDFTNGGTGAGSTLTGAQITLGDAQIASASSTPADVYSASTVLTPNVASATILGATAGNGAGTSLLDFGGTDGANKATAVTLSVPGSTTKLAGAYTSNLTWTLSDVPAS